MKTSKEMQACIDECLRCYRMCLGTAMTHCLEAGGEHVAPQHFRLTMACSEMCRTAAHFMLLHSPHHAHVCKECAEICTECAKDCERLGGMDDCVTACTRCAESCRAMAS
ncbi:four-helix bundle copper-binding protein [Bradyrhizobium diazoefficiens]|nr:four-helix bundle copper-binding protein [Bradyrhizobium diazoefficiens]MBR0967183.1 four-helix bundle copper-binding protein [Bradyrhizobium diazoefficiens]MBR0977401.1 four-helix bundle copper-binding protein [Bradyrhizobium diazoefficiens]MBR1013466.1 four-helix bundle copper-binding protein [Bradyrhizobium diazoefficiens]MBR1051723.1 four-helix bundle copper-binding protein [Bradyrhizobium diazoefficiens]MBR1108242.1 four-helix bundle copper-binding protein [Bradyrhizobium diazoefficien